VNREEKERLLQLCEQAATETDHRRLLSIIQELTSLLEAKKERLQTQDPTKDQTSA
jgi:hypothetical protein